MKALIGFAGFGGPEIALREAGFETLGIEIDPAIAQVNRLNGGNVLTADILEIDPADYIGWTLFHFSPPCPRFSVARSKSAKLSLIESISDLARFQTIINGESEVDLAMSRKICDFIRVCRPEYFTLENVWAYRHSLSWMNIVYALRECGYAITANPDNWHLNAADYGVPQTRKRMVVIARRDGRQPITPSPTHAKPSKTPFVQLSMLREPLKPWVGWYEAIQDLIPGLTETQFAPWQLDRMPDELKNYLMMTGNTNRNGVDNAVGRGWLEASKPANTVSTVSNGSMPRAFILGQGERSRLKPADLPADAVTANNNQTGIKGLIIDSANSNSNNGKGTMRGGNEPVFTVTTNEKVGPPKAFIVDCQNNGPPDANGQRGVTIRQQNAPIFTMTASTYRRTIRAALPYGRVVAMNARCLARFQDFPDRFKLSGEFDAATNAWLKAVSGRTARELACRGIGNALPPGMYRAVLGSLGLGGGAC